MKIIFIIVNLLISLNSFSNIGKLEMKLSSAKTNIEMKMLSYELQESYLKEIKILNKKIEKNLDKKLSSVFKLAEKNWSVHYSAERKLINRGLNSKKYGSSAGLMSATKENELLKSRYEYLKEMLKLL
jgi:hypothetical protein